MIRKRRQRNFRNVRQRTEYAGPVYVPAVQRRRRRTAATRNFRSGGFLGIENKFLDTELTSTALAVTWQALNPTGTGCTNSLSVPAEGDGESARDGREYIINSVHIKGAFARAATEGGVAPQDQDVVRAVLYIDHQSNGAEATATNIMDGGGTSDWLAFRNLQYTKRFTVLADKMFVIRPPLVNEGAANAFANQLTYVPFKMNKVFKKPLKVMCNATSANVSSCVDNNIGIAFVSSSVNVTVQYQGRVRFSG